MEPRRFALPALVLAALVAGCAATPSIDYRGVAPVPVEIDGREYRVWVRREGGGGQVQVVRMGYARRGQHDGLVEAMVEAAEHATGCRVPPNSVEGDTGVINARLACG